MLFAQVFSCAVLSLLHATAPNASNAPSAGTVSSRFFTGEPSRFGPRSSVIVSITDQRTYTAEPEHRRRTAPEPHLDRSLGSGPLDPDGVTAADGTEYLRVTVQHAEDVAGAGQAALVPA